MINYDAALAEIRSHGLLVSHLEVDGNRHRCRVEGMDREFRGWYYLSEWRASDGTAYVVGIYGVWQGNDPGTCRIRPSGVEMTASEKAAMRARLAADRKRVVAARAAEAATAARRAERLWAKLATTPPDGKRADYLERKGVESYGLRYTPSGALAIPLLDARGTVQGLQFVLPAGHPDVQKLKRDKDYWPRGVQKQGHWFQIGSVSHGGICLVAEGYATAATLHAATGLPVAVAFDAGNLRHVAAAIAKASRTNRLLICADDDYLQTCRACRKKTTLEDATCIHCGDEHRAVNAGLRDAAAAALQVGGATVAPAFPFDRAGRKLTDFNDLAQLPEGGLHRVRSQIEARLAELGWRAAMAQGAAALLRGGGEAGAEPFMAPRLSIEQAVARYWGTYGFGGDMLFDEVERRLVHKRDVCNLLPRTGWDLLKDHPGWRVAHDHQVGFDPTERDPAVLCNLFAGWPMQPQEGNCAALLSLLEHLCSGEDNAEPVYHWILRWLAYPLQHPGAKMHSAIVVHGPQGTGKSRFFEAVARIYGPYGRVLGQEALEDKFNADWAGQKLFIIADEVLARAELYQVKNRLKGFITGAEIRVNPKNLAAHTERNQMNLVFLSNERQPLVLENDDRRHLVLWAPPKPSDAYFDRVNAEIEAGGIEALYHYLLNLDLGDFRPWSRPPLTSAKEDLVQAGLSNEERFVQEWQRGELETVDGEPVPFCPALGSQLYTLYSRWCELHGERRRKAQDLIGHCRKIPGWQAGANQRVLASLRPADAASYVWRKMVVPAGAAMQFATRAHPERQSELEQRSDETKMQWLTRCFFIFDRVVNK